MSNKSVQSLRGSSKRITCSIHRASVRSNPTYNQTQGKLTPKKISRIDQDRWNLFGDQRIVVLKQENNNRWNVYISFFIVLYCIALYFIVFYFIYIFFFFFVLFSTFPSIRQAYRTYRDLRKIHHPLSFDHRQVFFKMYELSSQPSYSWYT